MGKGLYPSSYPYTGHALAAAGPAAFTAFLGELSPAIRKVVLQSERIHRALFAAAQQPYGHRPPSWAEDLGALSRGANPDDYDPKP